MDSNVSSNNVVRERRPRDVDREDLACKEAYLLLLTAVLAAAVSCTNQNLIMYSYWASKRLRDCDLNPKQRQSATIRPAYFCFVCMTKTKQRGETKRLRRVNRGELLCKCLMMMVAFSSPANELKESAFSKVNIESS